MDEQLIDQVSDVPRIIFFIITYRLQALKAHDFYFYRIIKKVRKLIETIFSKNFAKN